MRKSVKASKNRSARDLPPGEKKRHKPEQQTANMPTKGKTKLKHGTPAVK